MAAADSSDSVQEEIVSVLQQKPATSVLVDCKVKGSESWVPRTKKSVGYIVGGVVFNENGQVLLIQEAKASCRGQWYLPLGRLEPGETLVEGACREVLEEAGVSLRAKSLSSVQCLGHWYRFIFTGDISGKLKTLEEQDEESLEARFCDRSLMGVDLRCVDILEPIQFAAARDPAAPNILPLEQPHQHVCFRWILIVECRGTPHVLISRGGGKTHLPVIQAAPNYSCSYLLSSLLQVTLQEYPYMGGHPMLAAVEFCGKPKHKHDGALFTVVEQLPLKKAKLPATHEGFSWEALPTDGACCSELMVRLKRKHFVAIHQM